MYETLTVGLTKYQKEILKLHKSKSDAVHAIIDYDNYTIDIPHPLYPTKYIPTKTGLAFHRADDRIRVVRGHVGSGKTTALCAEIVFRACKMTPCKDGVRRSRWAVIRNTYGDLIKTTLHTWEQWYSDLGEMKKTQSPSFSIRHTFRDQHGLVELELLPIALDNTIDITKHLKSLEVTGVFLSELSELQKLILNFFSGGRLPRYPRLVDFPEEVQQQQFVYWSGIIADTNPPPEDSWIYQMFEIDKPQGYKMFAQPPAVLKLGDSYIVNPEAENIRNIPNGAVEYVNMTQGQDENFIRVYLMGEYGTLSSEKRVYPSYNDNIHSSEHLMLDVKEPLIISADLGTVAPTVLVAQISNGRVLCHREFCGQFMTMGELCESSVMPWLNENCKGMSISMVLHDPADTYDGAEQLRKFFGELVTPADTNNVEQRIYAVSLLLTRLIAGKGVLEISRPGCVQLRKGFNGMYHYKRLRVIGEERYTEEPNKNHPYSDCFASGTKITMANGSLKNIEDIKAGMHVLTSNGRRKVLKSWLARKKATVYEYTFSNGSKLVATPDHRMLTKDGWKSIDSLQYTDVLYSMEGFICVNRLKLFANTVKKHLKHLHGELGRAKEYIVRKVAIILQKDPLKVLMLTTNGLLSMEDILSTNVVVGKQLNCIGIFGKSILARFPMVNAFITKMETLKTMISQICRLWIVKNMQDIILKKDTKKTRMSLCEEYQKQEKRRKNGTGQKKAKNGILNILQASGKPEKSKNLFVQFAAKSMRLICLKVVSVLNIVSKKQGIKEESTTKLDRVVFAIKNLLLINIKRPKLVEVKIVSRSQYPEQRDVYDLTVDVDHYFFANGIIAHNCHDCLQYLALYANKQLQYGQTDNDDAARYDFKRARNEANRITGY